MLNFDKEPKVGGDIFVKLNDGEEVKGILQGEVRDFYIKWEDGKSAPCEEGDEGAKFRWRANLVIVGADGDMAAKILEQGPMMYKDLKEISQDYDLAKTVLKIKRIGTGLNTEYKVLPMPKAPSDESLETLKSVELHALEDTSESDATPF